VTLPLVIHPDVGTEIEEAAVWYEARRVGLGSEFVEAVDRALFDIAEAPGRSPIWSAPVAARGPAAVPVRRVLRGR
jgi:hypothetical protein